MTRLLHFLLTLSFFTWESSGEIVLTQTPTEKFVLPGESVTLQCQTSSAIGFQNVWRDTQYSLAWYHQRAGEAPKLLIHLATSRRSGVSGRFSGSGAGTSFSLTINAIQPEDAGHYYCQQYRETPYTFGGGTKLTVGLKNNVKPTVSVFPPSKDELEGNKKATLACLVNKFYPEDVKVEWFNGDSLISSDVKTSDTLLETDGTFSLSSTVTLTADQWNSKSTFYCKVTHVTLTPSQKWPVSSADCSV
ncbi:immunoglobulin kappa light chain-like [Polypterus senegalus]|uniref:immunoglobulin kappa light chain-like n=1 Tax=Polypterus senegalus TaxID=55291 RepID=UPI0019631809|nr:immunoglobulin kappa light chain-like [Polypterus senegalus]